MNQQILRSRAAPVLASSTAPDGADRPAPRLAGRARAVGKGLAVVLWTLPSLAVQAVLIALPGRGKVGFARLYWATVSRLLGVRVRVVGEPARVAGRATVFAANHSSWLDIPVLGGTLRACFVSKAEVGGWPVVGTVARLGRTVFVSRRATATGRERDDMRTRLLSGDNLILFPEGTSSDGSRVLPFRTTFFAVAEGDAPPLIQPVSVVYDRLAGLPVGRATRPVFAWYGDMDLASHFWGLAGWTGLRATVLLHPPLDPAEFANRKALSQHCWAVVADGTAQLRQNRPVQAGTGAPAAAQP